MKILDHGFTRTDTDIKSRLLSDLWLALRALGFMTSLVDQWRIYPCPSVFIRGSNRMPETAITVLPKAPNYIYKEVQVFQYNNHRLLTRAMSRPECRLVVTCSSRTR